MGVSTEKIEPRWDISQPRASEGKDLATAKSRRGRLLPSLPQKPAGACADSFFRKRGELIYGAVLAVVLQSKNSILIE
jgi:hypothetical protein